MRTVLLLLPLLMALGASSQTRMRELFRQMPDSIVPYLTVNNRLDFIDFIDSHLKAEVQNALDGRSRMTLLTDSALSITLNEASLLDMRLFSLTESADSVREVICLVRTYGREQQESTVEFYQTDWLPLPVTRFMSLPHGMFTAKFDGDTPTLTLTLKNSFERPASEEQKTHEDVLIILKWNGKNFK